MAGPIGYTRSSYAGATGPDNAVTAPAINTVGANFLAAVVTSLAAVAQAVVSDSQSNTWVPLTRSSVGGFNSVQIFYVQGAVTTDTAHTATVSAVTGQRPSITFIACNGMDSTPFDQEAQNTGGPTTTSITPSVKT